jgi:erythromycin esterase
MKSSKLILIIIIATASFASSCKSDVSALMNLDFEKIDSKSKYPINWALNSLTNDKVILDSSIVHKGKYSLMFEVTEKKDFGNSNTQAYRIIENIHTNSKINLSGYIRTENVTSDSAGLLFGYSTFYKDTILTLKDKRLIGTNEWQQFNIETTIKDEPEYCFVGIYLGGEGKIWVDDIEILVDGRELKKTPAKTKFKATNKELSWLKNNYTPINTVKAGSGFEDLLPLKQMIGNARIVGLGENTHGSSEVFLMKHRLVEFLATEMGFNIFSIEANMPEAYKLDNYIIKGEGDPKSLLKGMYFWTWNTQEVLDMIYWMKQFNTNGTTKIHFTGFDMQYYMGSVQNLTDYANKYNIVLKAKIDSVSSLFEKLKLKGAKAIESKDEIKYIKDKCENLHTYLIDNVNNIIHNSDTGNYKWLVQNSTVLIQCLELALRANSGFTYRDESMANNVKWILENNPDSKIVLWAHNGHITKQKGHLGYFLNREFENQYYNIGFVSNSGTYTAVNSGILNSDNKLEIGIPGSFEYTFHRIGTPIFYFDFSEVNDNEPNGQWLKGKHDFRSVGALALTKQFYPTMISKHFNAIIYLDSTKATNCFDVR